MAITISTDAPNFNFIILGNENNVSTVLPAYYSAADQRLKSVGYTHTILGMNEMASDALRILRPLELQPGPEGQPIYGSSGIWFSPDFPEFLLPHNNPLYKSSPQVIPNAITWGVVRTEPGTVGGPAFRGTREIHRRNREFLAVFGDDSSQYGIGETDSRIESNGGLA